MTKRVVNNDYGKEYIDSDRIANVYFTSDNDAKERIRSLNDLDKNNLKKLEDQLNMRMEIIINIIYK